MSHEAFPPDVPPIEPGDLEDALMAEAPAWPKVVGITSIVWASFWLLCGGCGIGMMFFSKQFLKMAEAQMGGPPPAVMLPTPLMMGLGVVGVVWTFVLLVAGITTASRRPVGRTLHLVYAVGSIIFSGVSTVVNVQNQAVMNAWAAANPADPWAAKHNPTMGYVMLGIMVVVGIGWPIFCLVWFGLVKRTAESMTGGVDEPAA